MTSWLLALLAVSTPFLDAIPNPRRSGSWISDGARIFADDRRNAIDGRLSQLEQELGVEIAVVTVADVGDEVPKEVATALFNRWGIGKRGRDNGLLLLLATKQRRLEMETGYGLEGVLPDSWLGLMQTDAMIPWFKQGDFGQGIDVGLQRIEARLREHGADLARANGAPATGGGSSAFAIVAVIMVLGASVALLVVLVVLVVRRNRRRCPSCKVAMARVEDPRRDGLLSAGQRAEERLGSVNHAVYQCAHCQAVRALAHEVRFSPFQRCQGCGFKTSHVATTTVELPTRFSAGLTETVVGCGNCGLEAKSTQVLPAIGDDTSSSWSSSSDSTSSGGGSSSDSSGGSFGGGSSGGGGAGSSW